MHLQSLPLISRNSRKLTLFLSTLLFLVSFTLAAKDLNPQHQLKGNDARIFESKVKKEFGPDGIRSKEYRNYVRKCSDGRKKKKGSVLYFDTTPFLLNEPKLCIGKVHILVAVHSYPPYRARRDVIRQTWGSVRQVGDKRIKLAFFVGKIESKQLQKEVQLESETYRDIIQRDFVESYRNMTRKHLTVIEWVANFCSNADYVMKTDDDTFTDIFHAVHLLSVLKIPGFYCTATVGAKPQRRNVGRLRKWRVTRREYAASKYPSYCEGLGYIMKTTVAKQLYWCSVFSNFFWIDDVYVGGVLPEKLKIPRMRFWNGHGHNVMRPSHAAGSVVDYIFLVAGNNEFMASLWRRLWKTVVVNSIDI